MYTENLENIETDRQDLIHLILKIRQEIASHSFDSKHISKLEKCEKIALNMYRKDEIAFKRVLKDRHKEYLQLVGFEDRDKNKYDKYVQSISA